MSDRLLAFEQVALRRGGRLLFEHLDLAVRAGEGLHLSGPNGAGKSSLLRLAAGLLRAEAGQVHRVASALANESPALDLELPLRRALAFWSRTGQRASKLDRMMDALGLTHLSEIPVRLLSAGQARRAALARVAASEARLWLLDEPLNGLDSASTARMNDLLDTHRAGGGGVVVASHLPLAGSWDRLELGK